MTKKIIICVLLISIIITSFYCVYAAELTNINVKKTNGEMTLTTDKETAKINDVITVSLKTNKKVRAAEFYINYDYTLLKFQNYAQYKNYYREIEKGKLYFVIFDMDGFEEFNFIFKVLKEGKTYVSSDIKLSYIDTVEELVLENKTPFVSLTLTDPPIINENLRLDTSSKVAKLTGINEKTNVNDLLTANNFSQTYEVKAYQNNKEIKDTNVGTGTIIKVFRGSELYKEYAAVVYGDTTGDGIINSVDALAIVKRKLKLEKASNDVFDEAGRVTEESRKNKKEPSSIDALKIVKYKLGTEKIIQ